MSEKVVREFRRQARKEALRAVETLKPIVDSAHNNESVTRERVDALERTVHAYDQAIRRRVAVLEEFSRSWEDARERPFLGRLRWVLWGR